VEREGLLAQAERLRGMLRGAGLDVGHSSTQIIPVILGDNERCVAVSRSLEERGILAIAIRPPAVPVGKSRLRLSLTANHSPADIEYLGQTVIAVVQMEERL
jgi:8-amino-7-oxononanoate synthase